MRSKSFCRAPFLLSALAFCLLCGCSHSTPEAAQMEVVQPKRGPITRNVTLPGEVKAYQQATLYAKVAGYLKTITVDKGDRIKEGTLLAEIEVPELLADRG